MNHRVLQQLVCHNTKAQKLVIFNFKGAKTDEIFNRDQNQNYARTKILFQPKP